MRLMEVDFPQEQGVGPVSVPSSVGWSGSWVGDVGNPDLGCKCAHQSIHPFKAVHP